MELIKRALEMNGVQSLLASCCSLTNGTNKIIVIRYYVGLPIILISCNATAGNCHTLSLAWAT